MSGLNSCEVERVRTAESFSDGAQLLRSHFWADPLNRFAKATGMTVSLYDSHFLRQSGPFGQSPIFEALRRADVFEEGEAGHEFEVLTAKKASSECVSFHGCLSICTAPVFIDDELIGILVAGWIPNSFADAVTSKRAAEALGLLEFDMWQAIRSQQPMTVEKMRDNIEMLKNFVEAMLLQLRLQKQNSAKTEVLEVLNFSANQLANAKEMVEVRDALTRAVSKLVPNVTPRIMIFGENSDIETPLENVFDLTGQLSINHSLKFPILSSSRSVLGFLELSATDSVLRQLKEQSEFETLTTQAGLAIQKIKLIKELYRERELADQANAELRAMHRMKDEFLATISHELRTPLNSVLGWSELLTDEMVEPEEFHEAHSAIFRNAKIQAKLIEDLLDVSRMISGKMVLERNVMNLSDVIQLAIETVRPVAEAKDHKFVIHIPDEPLAVRGDPVRLQQVVWNILSNSVKFTPHSGTLTISLQRTGGYAKIVISDNGKGIKAEFLPHLFDRFSQADGSNSRAYGGLGLGLAIVRHIVELHGGSITAHSDGDGMGSSFEITLPINLSESELLLAQKVLSDMDSRMAISRSHLKGLKVLAVDDEMDALRLVKFVLEKAGAIVHGASNIEEAMAEFKDWHPDLVLSDIAMPGGDGYSFIHQVRELSVAEGGLTPAFAITAFAGENNRQAALNAGFQQHFSKPIDPKKLLASVKEISNLH